MRKAPVAMLAFLACTFVSHAKANDSTAELGTGGLVYVTTDAIRMASEDLFISMDAVRVRYSFENVSNKDMTTLVAFPMPDIQGSVDFMVAIPVNDPVNFLGFKTLVDGKPVTADVEQRVTALGVDQTETLRQLGIPLAPQLEATRTALDKVPKEKWDELVGLGLVAIDEYDAGAGWRKALTPMWRLSTAYYWRQTFPAKRTVIVEHSYHPSVGTTVGTSFGDPQARTADWYADYAKKYCVDAPFTAAARKAATGRAEDDFLMENRIEYILTTAANWAGPIDHFHLTIDKGLNRNLLSFCGEGVKKTGPTTFEVTRSDFYPDRDLSILILSGAASAK